MTVPSIESLPRTPSNHGCVAAGVEHGAELAPAILAAIDDVLDHCVDAIGCGDRFLAEAFLLKRVEVAPAILARHRHHDAVAHEDAADVAVLQRRERRDPAALTEAGKMNAIAVDPGLRAQPADRCDDVVREHVKVLQVFALRLPCPALVEGERGEAVRGVHVGLVVVIHRAVRLRAVHDDDGRERTGAVRRRLGQHQLAAQLQIAARKHRRAFGQIDPARLHDFVVGASPVEAALAGAGRGRELEVIDDGLALIPACAAFVLALAGRPEHRAFAVHLAIAQNLALARSDEDQRAVRERIRAGEPRIRQARVASTRKPRHR